MLYLNENTLPHIANYEKTIFKKKKNSKVPHDALQLRKNPQNIWRSKKAYGLKISQRTIYVKEYFYVFLYPEKYYTSTK